MAVDTSPLSRQPTKLDYASPTQFRFGIHQLPKVEFFAVTATLPASPALGDEVRIIDATGQAATNNITVNRNGKPIQGSAANLTIATNRAAIGLVYYDATQGWLLIEN